MNSTTETTIGKLTVATHNALELHEQQQAALYANVETVRDGLTSAAGLLDELTAEQAEMFESFPDAVEWALREQNAEKLLAHAEAALTIFDDNEGWTEGRTAKALREFVRSQYGIRDLARKAGKHNAA